MPEEGIANLSEKIGISGYVSITGYDPEIISTKKDYQFLFNNRTSLSSFFKQRLKSAVIKQVEGPNVVLNPGADQIVNLILGLSSQSINQCVVGSSNSSPTDKTLTALLSQISTAVTVTNKYLDSVGRAHIDTFFANSDNQGTWKETGLKTADGLILVCRKTLADPGFTKGNFSAVVAWTLIMTAI